MHLLFLHMIVQGIVLTAYYLHMVFSSFSYFFVFFIHRRKQKENPEPFNY